MIEKILKAQIKEVEPDENEILKIKKETEKIISVLEKVRKKKKISAEIFVGGSLAKGTIIKKDKYDIDIFIRFDKKYKKTSELLEKILKIARIKAEKIHGSRDYFKIKREIIFEVIPVLKINKPEEAENITDLSYFHVSYILKQVKKNPKLKDDIILAKSFCFAQKCYGAESYIRGFSGYALELLVSYYGSFLKFIKAIAKSRKKIIIDAGKFYKNKDDIMLNLNEAKLQSAIIFVDPTFKERNVLAALSQETLNKFQKACKEFLKKPSNKFFMLKKIVGKKFNFILEAYTNRQEGDIAGSKLIKFFNFLSMQIEKYFYIRNKEFEYLGRKARYYFFLKPRKEIILQGPPINKIENLINFKAKHKNIFIKKGKAYAREKIRINIKSFLNEFKKKNKEIMKEMGIISLSS